jgi:hypothetical protein
LRRCAYHAKVMKTLEPISSSVVGMMAGMFEPAGALEP